MLSFKVFLFFLVYVLIDVVTCERDAHRKEGSIDGNLQYQGLLTGEHQYHIPPLLVNRISKLHYLKRRSAFLKPLKHVVGHVVGHVREHLRFHRPHAGCRDEYLHPTHEFSLHHEPDFHPGHNVPNNVFMHHDSQEYYGPPKFPQKEIPTNDGHKFDFEPYGPKPLFHHHGYSNDKNNHDYGFHEKPEQGISEEINKLSKTDIDQTITKKTQVIYPPPVEDQDIRKNNNHPVNDFDTKTVEKKIYNPNVEGSSVDLESDLSADPDDDVKNNGSAAAPDWVNPNDDVEDKESGEIPPSSKIDIRFRKD